MYISKQKVIRLVNKLIGIANQLFKETCQLFKNINPNFVRT